MRKLTKNEKELMEKSTTTRGRVMNMIDDGVPIKQIAEELHIKRSYCYTIIKKFKELPLKDFLEDGRKTQGNTRILPEIIKRVQLLYISNPKLSYRSIAKQVSNMGKGYSISHETVRVLVRKIPKTETPMFLLSMTLTESEKVIPIDLYGSERKATKVMQTLILEYAHIKSKVTFTIDKVFLGESTK